MGNTTKIKPMYQDDLEKALAPFFFESNISEVRSEIVKVVSEAMHVYGVKTVIDVTTDEDVDKGIAEFVFEWNSGVNKIVRITFVPNANIIVK